MKSLVCIAAILVLTTLLVYGQRGIVVSSSIGTVAVSDPGWKFPAAGQNWQDTSGNIYLYDGSKWAVSPLIAQINTLQTAITALQTWKACVLANPNTFSTMCP